MAKGQLWPRDPRDKDLSEWAFWQVYSFCNDSLCRMVQWVIFLFLSLVIIDVGKCTHNINVQSISKRRNNIMTLLELQKVLGEQINAVTKTDMTKEERSEAIKTADTVAKLAKQMINNADVVLRADKLINSGMSENSSINGLVK